MENVIIFEIEVVNTCFGLSAKFSKKGQDGFTQCDAKNAVDNMCEIRNRYKMATGQDVVFIIKDAEGVDTPSCFCV